jgi:cytochrome oxidase Cu insertion factor (SCO1/SenC/PrrC family)
MKPVLRWWEVARGKMAGTTLAALTLLTFIFLGGPNLSFSQLPISSGAPYVGQKAPDFTLPDQNGKPISLGELLKPGGTGKSGGLVLIFYRGYW